MNYQYVYLGFLKDGEYDVQKVKFGEFNPHPPGLQDFTTYLQNSIKDTILAAGTFKTVGLALPSVPKNEVKAYYLMGDNLTKFSIPENTFTAISTKDGITTNNFNLTVGGNSTNTKPSCGPFKVGDAQLASTSSIWNSAYLDKNSITFQTFVNCELPAGSFHGWFCHQVGSGTYDKIFIYLVSSNYWENGVVPPFGDPTPGGTIGGYGTYDDTSDNFPIPPNRLNDVYSSILSNVAGKIQMYTLDSGAYSAFLGKIYTSDFWDYWKQTIFNPIDGIYSCIRVPFSELDLTRTAVAKINVSNTELEILAGAYRVTNNYVKDQVIISNYVIDEYFGSFLDYSPYTTCELYIPFYGTVNIDINEIMGGNISITRRNNYVNGDFVVFVQCVNRFGIAVTHAYAGNAAITLPITAGNDGSPNRILDLVQGVANLAMGNYVGAGTSAVNALTEKGTATTIQKLSGGSGWNASHDFALIFRRSCPSNPENYTKENGRQADEFVNFSDLQGYTEVSAVDLKFTSGKITSAEIDEINNLLKQGVFF